MSMHLEKIFISTTNYSSKGKKLANTASLREATAKHEAWLRKQGLHPEQRALKKAVVGNYVHEIPDYRADLRNSLPLSNTVGNGYKTGVMVNLHKESAATQKEIIAKSKRLAPAYSKGAYQYITPGSDVADLGKKK